VVDDVENGGIIRQVVSGCASPTENDVQCARYNEREPDDTTNVGGWMTVVDKCRYGGDLKGSHGGMRTVIAGRCDSWRLTKAKLPMTYPISAP
jgi:hypothetical protein